MARQLFNLAADPMEEHDLLADGRAHPKADELEKKLRERLDPEAVDARSKADQAAHMEAFGGAESVRKEGLFTRSPIPGKSVEMENVAQRTG